MSSVSHKHRSEVFLEPERIQKLLAGHGLGSRREIELLIAEGRVQVNGHTVRLGDKATSVDEILIDQKRVSVRRQIISCALLYHKPCSMLVTRKDPRKRPTVFSMLPKPLQGRWVAVGRLDCNTSGLLIVCNDGELVARMMHPSYRLEREYRVRVYGHVTKRILHNLREGVLLGGRYAKFDMVEPCTATEVHGVNRWFRVVLSEGRNREVRRLWQSQGMEVSRLERTRFCFLRLDTSLGTWRWLTADELTRLYQRVNLPAAHYLTRIGTQRK